MTQITIPDPAQVWQGVVSKKRQLRAEAISASIGGSTNSPKELEITAIAEASQLVSEISRGELTSEDIVKAYIRKASEVHNKTNCLTEIVFDDALKRAKELDTYFTEHGKTVGPLHGVPVTLKDQFNVKGYDTTLGYVGRSFKPAADDAVVVKMLQSLGAVVVAKTNLPQSIMWCETDNPLWGLTTNPRSRDYTPGGSTGGEAALLASGASMLGWGTDIGGSIRIPSHMMGTYGFKPSSGRLPYRGVPVSTEGQEHVPSSIGPMARSLSTIRLAMEQLINAKPWELDARCAPVPWREDLYKETSSRPLTIGVLYDDNVVQPHPPLTRVLRSAVERLQAAGHEVLEWNASLHEDCIRTMDLFYTVDGGEDIRKDVLAGGEPFIPHVEKLLNRGKAISVYDYWQLNRRKWDLQQAYLEKWQSIRSPKTGRMVDILLLPPMPHSAVPHGGCRWVGYTKVWNFLDYPALVIPGGQVSREDIDQPWAEEARGVENEWNRKLWDDNKETMASLSLPVGLQIVGRKLAEEMVLAAGKIIDGILKHKS
ncbi:amidase [Colletotrichum costaricense]|uniref:Amidase n=1 Tax=Colletotrichum costaricense TaxID=1209916 RepID=A0AAJ0E605_9PEZI|nr:amidase [Colletotrichum costaricense]KAK1539010.1 amidase [Colletotrichum costaricense]